MESINQINTNSTAPVDRAAHSIVKQDLPGKIRADKRADHQQPVKQTEQAPKEGMDFPKLVSTVNNYVDSFSTKVSFSYDEHTNKPVIRVTDKETGELIRQIPKQEMLDLISKLEYVAGIIYHNKA